MRVLFVSYAFSRSAGSEARMSYNLIRALKARGHDVRVITKDPQRSDDTINVRLSKRLKGSAGIGKAHKLDYFPFIRAALSEARAVIDGFDLVHHVSPRSLRYPDPLARLGVPFIWGPIGGSIAYPPGFSDIESRESRMQRLRLLDGPRLRLDPTLRTTLRRAAAIVVTSTAARARIPDRYHDKLTVIPEEVDLDDLTTEPIDDVLRDIDAPYVFSSGRLIPYKATDLLLRSFARVLEAPVADRLKLVITGDGPERQRLITLRDELGLGDRVLFLGKIERARNLSLMQQAQCCVFPALNEAFGGVNLEAMAMGQPIVVTDWGGPADIVLDGQTGYKVAPRSVQQLVEGIAERIRMLLADEQLRRVLGKAARARVEATFTTFATVPRYEALYERVLSGHSSGERGDAG